MTGGLFDPLGTDRADLGRDAPRRSVPVILAAVATAALAALLAISYLRDDGDRGRPVAVAPIEHVQPPPKPAVPPPAAAAPAVPPAAPPSARDDQEVEVQNGVRIIRPRRSGPAQGGQTVPVPDPKAAR